jgi:Papain family cysteine protease
VPYASVGELKAELAESRASWNVHERFQEDHQVPRYPLGVPEGYPRADEVEEPDLEAVLADAPLNHLLAGPRARVGLLPAAAQQFLNARVREEVAGLAAAPPGHAPAIDWRNRFGTSWVTGIRDQNPCENCWAFATAGLVESMVRINHDVWCVRSEGDLRDGMSHTCAQGEWPNVALDWIKQHGLADPRCYPWYAGNHAYAPTPDRPGRVVGIDDYTTLTTLDSERDWVDGVGPLIAVFAVYDDFFAYGSGVYRKSPTARFQGLHAVLIVGYDDGLGCWIIKNSWGAGWGDHGYFRIAYGQCDIETYAKQGLTKTNPDPVTKRRLHNGNLLESGWGTYHNNFELVATAHGPGQGRHWWRDNSTAGFPWHQGPTFANDMAACPTLIETSYGQRNLECVYLTTNNRLHHWWRNQANGQWNDGGVFGPNDAAGIPGFIQSNYGAPGNFEVVVRTADGRLNHWWRDGAFVWHDGGRFAQGMALSGASLIQSTFGTNGNLELVAVCHTGELWHWWRDDDHGMVWNPGPCFGQGVSSPPVMIQGQYGMGSETANGNFELCVAVGGRVQHWWRDNQRLGQWAMSATFGHDVQAVAGLVEGSFGFNLEVIVLRTDQQLQHYWRDGAGWHEGPILGPA